MAVTVQFDGTDATEVVVVSDTELTATTPAGTGVVDVTVTTSGGSDTLADGYTYEAAGPVLTAVTPSVAYTGAQTRVTLTYTGGVGGMQSNLTASGSDTLLLTAPQNITTSTGASGFVAPDGVLSVGTVYDVVIVIGGEIVSRLPAAITGTQLPTLTNPNMVNKNLSPLGAYAFTYDNGSVVPGATVVYTSWFFPSGTTSGGFNNVPASVTATSASGTVNSSAAAGTYDLYLGASNRTPATAYSLQLVTTGVVIS